MSTSEIERFFGVFFNNDSFKKWFHLLKNNETIQNRAESEQKTLVLIMISKLLWTKTRSENPGWKFNITSGVQGLSKVIPFSSLHPLQLILSHPFSSHPLVFSSLFIPLSSLHPLQLIPLIPIFIPFSKGRVLRGPGLDIHGK